MKLKFEMDTENSCYLVFAKRKITGKFEQIGTCHLSAKKEIEAGKLELLQLNMR